MPICRLLYRLDFKVRFEMLDKPGAILNQLDSITYQPEKLKFFDQIGEKIDIRLVEAISVDKDNPFPLWSRRIGVRPESIDVNIENIEGLNIDELADNSIYKKLTILTDYLRQKFHISDLNRAGLRIFYFAKIGEEPEKTLHAFKEIFDQNFSSMTEDILGSINDVGIVFDGKHDDQIGYHFRCGPYWADEAKKKKYLSLDIDKLGNDYNVIMDLDIFETNFTTAIPGSVQSTYISG